jgi:hypothetical protein
VCTGFFDAQPRQRGERIERLERTPEPVAEREMRHHGPDGTTSMVPGRQ